jgi:regulator of replication initiation timing
MGILNYKEKEQTFDMFKCEKPKQKISLGHSVFKWMARIVPVPVTAIFFSVLLINNISHVDNYLKVAINHEHTQLQTFVTMRKVIDSGDQNEIIKTFSKLKFDKTALSDVLSAEVIKEIVNEKFKDQDKKISKETKKTLLTLYSENWNYGTLTEKEEQNLVMACYSIDVVCDMDILDIKKQQHSEMLHLQKKNEALKLEIAQTLAVQEKIKK